MRAPQPCIHAVPLTVSEKCVATIHHPNRLRFGPLFEELKGDFRMRSLFILMVALPFQLLRSVFIGFFVSENNCESLVRLLHTKIVKR